MRLNLSRDSSEENENMAGEILKSADGRNALIDDDLSHLLLGKAGETGEEEDDIDNEPPETSPLAGRPRRSDDSHDHGIVQRKTTTSYHPSPNTSTLVLRPRSPV